MKRREFILLTAASVLAAQRRANGQGSERVRRVAIFSSLPADDPTAVIATERALAFDALVMLMSRLAVSVPARCAVREKKKENKMIGIAKRQLVRLSAALLITAAGIVPALSEPAKKDAAPAATSTKPPVVLAPTLEVTGFRSAKFGMNEADVRAAIVKDLGVKPEAIRTETNASEQTRVLLVKAPEVLPGGGVSEVSYVFGYKSKTLIQVGATWSKATDEKMTADQLFSNSTVLRTHFIAAGYKADTIATNMPISGGILMFRGSDAKDHTTMLILQGTLAKDEKDQNVLTPTGLLLFYVADAKAPDVYRLPPGSF